MDIRRATALDLGEQRSLAVEAGLDMGTNRVGHREHGVGIQRHEAAALREDGITAEASDVISHLRIELPTTQLAAANAVLAGLQLI